MELVNIDSLVDNLEKEKGNADVAKQYIQKIFSVFQGLEQKNFEQDIQPIIEAIKSKLTISGTSQLDIGNPNIIEDTLKIAYIYQVLKLKLETRKKLKKEVILKTSSSLLTIAKSESLFGQTQRDKFKTFLLDPKNHEVIEEPKEQKNESFERVKSFVTSAVIGLTFPDKKEIPQSLKEKFFIALTQNYIDFCNSKKIRIENIIGRDPAALVTGYYIEQKSGNGIYSTYIPSQRGMEEVIHNTFLALNLTPEEKKLILDVKIRITGDGISSANIQTYLLRVFGEQIRSPQKVETQESKGFIELFKNIKGKDSIDISSFPTDFKEVCYSFIKGVIFLGKDEVVVYDKSQKVKKTIHFEKSKEDILKNLIVFIAYTLDIESNFSNKVSPISSSASGYVQFPNGNFGGVVNMGMLNQNGELPPGKKTKLSQQSLGTAIIRTSSLIRALKVQGPYRDKIDATEHLLRIHNDTFGLKTSDLDSDIQVLLFLGNIFNMTREDFVGNNGVKKRGVINRNGTQVNVLEYLSQTMLNGSEFYLSRTYGWLHHSSPDEATKSVRTNRLLSYRTLLKSIESGAQDTVVLKTVSHALKEKIQTSITGPSVTLGTPGINSFLRELLLLIGYSEFFPIEEGSEQSPKKKDIKDLIKDFQIIEGIPGANGSYGPKTKERIESILHFYLQGGEGEEMEGKIIELINKYFPKEQIKTEGEKPLLRTLKVFKDVSIKEIPKNINIFSFKISQIEINQSLDFLEKNKDAQKKLIDYLVITEKQILEIIKNIRSQTQRYGMNYSSRVFIYYIKAIKEGKLPTLVKDFSTIQVLANEKKLVEVESENSLWRIETGKLGKKESGENKKLLRYLTPKSKEVLIEIATRFQNEVLKRKLSETIKPRIIINSLVRPKQYNSSTENSSSISAHILGFGFDISNAEYDLTENGSFATITNKKIEKHNAQNQLHETLVGHFNNILKQILIDLDRENKIILTWESSHPHITVVH